MTLRRQPMDAAWCSQARGKAIGGVCKHVLPSALLACAVAELPALFGRATMFWLWGVLAVVVGSAAAFGRANGPLAGRRQVWQDWWVGALAVGAGATADFLVLPPDIMLSLCRSDGGIDLSLAAVGTHLRMLPATSAAMLLAIVVTQSRARPGQAPFRRVLAIAFDYAAMSVAMALSVVALEAMADGARLPWTADGMCLAMLAGMLLAPALVRFCGAGAMKLCEK